MTIIDCDLVVEDFLDMQRDLEDKSGRLQSLVKRLEKQLEARLVNLEQRVDTLELDQEVLWDDMETRTTVANVPVGT